MHEFVLDLSGYKEETGVSALDVAKTLIDYNGQMYDIDKIDRQIKNSSNLSSSQKSSYGKELNTARNAYTTIAAFNIATACAGVVLGTALGPVGGLLFGALTGII